LEEKVLKLEKRSEKEGFSEEERLSIDKMIIALTIEKAALTNKEVELMKVAQGIVHDHM
jgi:hypothetical protein